MNNSKAKQNWIFDLDDVLASTQNSGLADQTKSAITQFIIDEGVLDSEAGADENRIKVDAYNLMMDLYKEYGSTYVGLVRKNMLDDAGKKRFEENVYGKLDFTVLEKDDKLKAALSQVSEGIDGKMVVLTSSHSSYAKQVLKHLEIDGYFSNIWGVGETDPAFKPEKEVFDMIMCVESFNPKTTVFCDDNNKHIAGAKQAGIETTAKINSDGSVEVSIVSPNLVSAFQAISSATPLRMG